MAGDNARKLLNSSMIEIFTQSAADNCTTLKYLWTGGWKQKDDYLYQVISIAPADMKQYRTFGNP